MEKVGKKEIIRRVKDRTGMSLIVVDKIFEAIIEEMKSLLINDYSITIKNFGNFENTRKKARTFKSGLDKEVYHVYSHKSPVFRPSPRLKERINY